MQNNILIDQTFIFVIENCPFCHRWVEFIERLNKDLKFEKRVRIIDCTKYYQFGIIDPILRFFYKQIDSEYPVLFHVTNVLGSEVIGLRKDGTNSVTEAEAWIRSLLNEDFISPQENQYMFRKECDFINKKGIFNRRIICQG